MNDQKISSFQNENRQFSPSYEFTSLSTTTTESIEQLQKLADTNIVQFWEVQAKKLHWFRLWEKAFQWDFPFMKWFEGGKTNLSYNCLDIHLGTNRTNKAALIWESEPGEVRTLTYLQLHREVCKVAESLLQLDIKSGEVVAIYMGNVPEAAIAMLACARIGAVHNVIFGGFSEEALKDRMNDSKAVCLITQDVAQRKGTYLQLKETADLALPFCPTVQHCIVFQRNASILTKMISGRDHWWHELLHGKKGITPAVEVDSEHPLFILYTSGSTGKPKGIFHTTGGYATQVRYSFEMVFDIKDSDVYFCTADVGWITGHSYITYGPLMHGATVLMYEGTPTYPTPARIWEIIDRHRVSILYTAPTAIRSFMSFGEQFPLASDLSSLRLLGTVGEPINPEAWMWYHTVIGKKKCPIVDTWWQTETGSIMISPIPSVTVTTPGTATNPLPGVIADVVRSDGTSCDVNEGGYLVIKHPVPSMLRTVYGDSERYEKTYWSEFPVNAIHNGYYFTGDGARKDEFGNFWIMGRVDDVVNVSGHRLGTAEVESALVSHPDVAEAAVIAKPDEVKGNVLIAFVTMNKGTTYEAKLMNDELRHWVAKEIGSIARPDEIRFTEQLPKTRSGKIMRRLLREIVASGTISGDITTLEDFSSLESLRKDDEE